MKQYISKGIICFNVDKIVFYVAKITYTYYQNEKFSYTFVPNYSVIDILSSFPSFQGIPGINLDLRKKEYIRENIHPVFIAERVPMKNRIDYYNLLKKSGLEFFDPIRYLINTKDRYSGDNLYVIDNCQQKNVSISINQGTKNNLEIMRELLVEIAKGNNINFGGLLIDDSNRKITFNVVYKFYQKAIISIQAKRRIGIDLAKAEGKYKGRKPISVDKMMFLETLQYVDHKELTPKQAARKLNISIDKYYRLKKQSQN